MLFLMLGLLVLRDLMLLSLVSLFVKSIKTNLLSGFSRRVQLDGLDISESKRAEQSGKDEIFH